jgi:hypothetical protein
MRGLLAFPTMACGTDSSAPLSLIKQPNTALRDHIREASQISFHAHVWIWSETCLQSHASTRKELEIVFLGPAGNVEVNGHHFIVEESSPDVHGTRDLLLNLALSVCT